jgi:hypothetical protein
MGNGTLLSNLKRSEQVIHGSPLSTLDADARAYPGNQTGTKSDLEADSQTCRAEQFDRGTCPGTESCIQKNHDEKQQPTERPSNSEVIDGEAPAICSSQHSAASGSG